ncbi:copper amine oxidase N-terminal domain-containing protein [Thermotalea metallivorans]|uniref:Copper amine oxidase-like N-terminal domain-containing protein n=1 Tax=Thermotalea metallivorans TaxID=520762 RepID=A0A140L507_9FIRM|nr:copper amine oxidase N-terminal domain-containing protein [Thermotalea metallivorans]KXG75632.1 hypothetical protein AN619_16280 [Thermotalea metallivorans]
MMVWKKAVSFMVIGACIFAAPVGAMAKGVKPEPMKNKLKIEMEQDDSGETGLKEKLKNMEWKAVKDALEAKKDAVEALKAQMEGQKEQVEAAYEAAKASGNLELAKELLEKISAAKADMEAMKGKMREIIAQMKEVVKNKYTEAEWEALKKAAEEMKKEGSDVQVIPVENIFSKKGHLKFDVPPVIKQGRTLIPVRAIAEGFGAQVTWNGEEQKVIITKGDVEIVFQLADGKVFVNGEEKTIDVPAGLINNRTVVPLRFIAENLGLKVNYDGETGIIEIEDEQETSTEGNNPAVGENTQNDVVTVVPVNEPPQDTVVESVEPAGENVNQ